MRVIPELLNADELAEVNALLDGGPWQSGAATAGAQARRIKDNAQLDPDSTAAREAGRIVQAALDRSPLFVAAALPARTLPPIFSRYAPGQGYGPHVDNALRRTDQGTLRADISATLFLSPPEDYDGGELVIETGAARQAVKLPAGALVLYPSTSVHQVAPVPRGVRQAAVLWIESLVRDPAAREILLELDSAVQSLGDHPSALRLTGVYHNLLRRWAGR
jgi:PKHD-type hydroxylase